MNEHGINGMDGSELDAFRKRWKRDIEAKCNHLSGTEKEENTVKSINKTGNSSGKVYGSNKAGNVTISSVKSSCKIFESEEDGMPSTSNHGLDYTFGDSKRQYSLPKDDEAFVQPKKPKGISLLNLDIPSYHDHNYDTSTIAQPHDQLVDDNRVNDEQDNQDYTALLIRDIDEITSIPFFDVSLPKEVCVKIFAYLNVNELCRCAYVSKAWSVLATDDLIWYNIYRKLGFKMQFVEETVSDRTDWKSSVKENILRQQLIEKNWKEMICHTETLEYEKGVAVSACNIFGNIVVTGYANGKTCLWDIESNWRQFLEPSAEVVTDPPKASAEHISVSDSVCATGFICGVVNVWHTDISVQPVYQFRLPNPANNVILAKSGHSCTNSVQLLTSSGSDVRIDQILDNGQWGMVKTKHFENQVSIVNLFSDVNEGIFAIALKEDVFIYIPNTDSVLNLDKITGTRITAMTSSSTDHHIAVGWAPYGFGVGGEFTTKARLYDQDTLKHTQTFLGHYGEITCLNLNHHQHLITGSKDKRVRIYDLRTEQPQMCLRGQSSSITTVQMDSWKAVSGAYNGTIKVWDIRKGTILWEINGHHPVRLCQFKWNQLVTANIPLEKVPRESMWYADDLILHRRHRGAVKVLDFGGCSESVAVPDEMRSGYDDTAGYNYNINLVAPYDDLTSEIN